MSCVFPNSPPGVGNQSGSESARVALSITTICKNNPKDLRRTLKSIGGEFEVIVQDGSDDERCASVAAEFGLTAHRERDDGLYDALNRATQKASGDQVMVINSGDELYDARRLRKLTEQFGRGQGVALYGDHIASIAGRRVRLRAPDLSPDTLRRGPLPCHQAIILPREYVLSIGYDARLRFAADAKLLRRAFVELRPIYLDEPLAVFTHGGLSNVPRSWSSVLAHYAELVSVLDYTPGERASLLTRLLGRKLAMSLLGREALLRLQHLRASRRSGAVTLERREAQTPGEQGDGRAAPTFESADPAGQ